MGILDLFSGKAGRLAAMQGQQALQGVQGNVTGYLDKGLADATGYINQAQPLSLGALSSGREAAMGMYSPYAQTGGAGFNMLANSLGLNGAGGSAAAQGAFQASPGYQFRMDEALEAVKRHQNSLGGTDSGNTYAALLKRAGDEASAEYRPWQQMLAGIGQTGYGATGAQAGIESDYGKGVADIYSGDAARKANIVGTTTALGANSLSQLGQKQAEIGMSGAMAGQQGSANALSALLGLLGMGTNIGTAWLTGPKPKSAVG
jgi:hypothetical protein